MLKLDGAKSLILDVSATPDVTTTSPVGGQNQCILGYLEVLTTGALGESILKISFPDFST